MQKIKTTSTSVFLIYFQRLKHVYQAKFSKHNFKQPDDFTKYVKFSMILEAQNYEIITLPRQEKISSVLFGAKCVCSCVCVCVCVCVVCEGLNKGVKY